MCSEILSKIKEADMVLVGLGEEFDDTRLCRKEAGYQEGRTILENLERSDLLPAYDTFFRMEKQSRVRKMLEKLAQALEEKNYFVVSVSTNDEVRKVSWKDGRFVAPCGGSHKKQCIQRCSEGLQELSEGEENMLFLRMREFASQVCNGQKGGESKADKIDFGGILGTCPKCGSPLVLNNIYTEFYDESGYLELWQQYRKWLQGTLNRRLLILELGVGLQCPTVIRWPFEKMAFYNQKAWFYRVHETLYQMSAEMNGKGTSIAENAIDWLKILC